MLVFVEFVRLEVIWLNGMHQVSARERKIPFGLVTQTLEDRRHYKKDRKLSARLLL